MTLINTRWCHLQTSEHRQLRRQIGSSWMCVLFNSHQLKSETSWRQIKLKCLVIVLTLVIKTPRKIITMTLKKKIKCPVAYFLELLFLYRGPHHLKEFAQLLLCWNMKDLLLDPFTFFTFCWDVDFNVKCIKLSVQN